MVYTFAMLLAVIITLLFYFSERNRFLSKVEDLTANLQKEMEERLNLETRYSKVLNDFKREEEFNKSKKIDETQLMFTKVNMLDDKLTYFNTTFKTKLENIIELLAGSSTKNVQKNNTAKDITDVETFNTENQPAKIEENDKTETILKEDNKLEEENTQKQNEINNQILENNKEPRKVEVSEGKVSEDIIENDSDQNEKIEENNEANDLSNLNLEENIEEKNKETDKENDEESEGDNDEEDEEESDEDNGENGSGNLGDVETNKNSQNKSLNNNTYEKLKPEEANQNIEESKNTNTENTQEISKEVDNSSTDKEIENALFEETDNDIDFKEDTEDEDKNLNTDKAESFAELKDVVNNIVDYDEERVEEGTEDESNKNVNTVNTTSKSDLNEVVDTNNNETKLEEDLKLNTDITEGFDIKGSIEKLRAQLEEDKK
ncbi:MAG: hypothetical protein PHY80_05525 [Rickettsiales bacterium]|nr:hypothetical protein [Rickettsiales bacterium]